MQKYIKFEEATKLGFIHLKTCQTSYGNNMECENAELKLVT